MRSYEVAYIADPELDDEQLEALEERVKSLIETASGKLVNVEHWGKRKLAYAIRKKSEGHYVIMDTELPPEAGNAIGRDLRLSEQIMRFLITLKDG